MVLAGEIVAAATIATMVSIILYVEYSFSRSMTSRKIRYSLYFVLLMMASMFVGLSWYLVEPKGFLDSVISINIIMIPMVSFLVLIFYFYSMEWKGKFRVDRVLLPTLFVINEVLMTVFVLIVLGIKQNSSVMIALPQTVNSLYFVLPMEVEMVVSIVLFRIKGLVRVLLIVLAGMDFVSPALFSSYRPELLVANAMIMVAGMIVILEEASNSKTKIASEKRRIIDISLVVYLINSIGFFLSYSQGVQNEGNWTPYALSVLFGMWIYFFFIFTGRDVRNVDSWINKKWWLFFLLSSTFATELTMSIPLDITVGFFHTRGTGLALLSYLITNAGGLGLYGNVFLSIVPFIGVVAASPMFLLLMGTEMGALVIFRIKKIKWLEKRINLSFALIAYFTYTLYGPSYIIGWSKLPLWANVGALGPVRGDLIVPLMLSYGVYAVLAVLFGRRSYCGTLCPSAVMYGGTLGQEMISMNYKSRLSKKNIGSKYSSMVQTIIGGSWIFMLASAMVSFAISIKLINLPFDPAILYSYLIWNFLWYLFFISIPFTGMSPCRRYGWCTTGTFVGFFSKLGFFRIKAVDSGVCLRCPTKDCVTACEVGLGDLPAQFIKNGFFKSQKCVGSGSCIDACPYDNIHFYDIRNVIKDKLAPKSLGTE
ncbi:MAG: 4Fe-4S binding protein [Thermoplasmatales archaeon]|nr:4Fe-4S binding protein [Candidatus Thermoplasmatota archaeon]MCL6002053.1 4Fe-4S binding protein [Candidatus Thermoplasmatota archaeon]MDA8054626.1 4Fe-4S binding protein [Thermoplasmatales archaeon]